MQCLLPRVLCENELRKDNHLIADQVVLSKIGIEIHLEQKNKMHFCEFREKRFKFLKVLHLEKRSVLLLFLFFLLFTFILHKNFLKC